jgi:putative ABC transport system permease protein
MLQNYFKVALRNIRKHKFYAALNILGLASGLTASFLVGLYIVEEITFDRFHKDYQNIYHVGMHVNFGGQEFKTASSVPPLAQAMLQTIPGVEEATRLNPWPLKKVVMKYRDKAFKEDNAFLADSNFFKFFNFKLLEGNVKTVLKEPYTMVLTAASANRYFGNESPIGKIITVGNKNEAYTVTGIAEQAPTNSHIQYDMLLSSRSDQNMQAGDWSGNDGTYTYIRKNPETPLSSIQSKLRDLVMQHVAPELEGFFGVSFKEFEKQGGIYSYFAFPLSRGHLYYHDEIPDGPYLASDIRYVYIMGAVGSFILLIACINFMNLSTARSANRAKEVGMRKTLGSVRSKLIVQFLSESFVYAFAATVIAIAGVYLLLPGFNLLSGKKLFFNTLLSPAILAAIAAIFVAVALLAGSYPAFYLTSFKPIDVLKGKVSAGMKSKGVRSSLVVVQFAMSISLMICTMVVYDQLGYLQEKNIGLDKQNVLVLQNVNRLGTNQDAFFESVNNQSGIVKASYTNNEFPQVNGVCSYRVVGTTRDLLIPFYGADYDHLDVLKIELLQGRYFSREFASDSMAVVLNEAAVRELGLPDPLNGKLQTDATAPALNVIGVVKDFNFESFKSNVKPLVITLKERSDFMLIRYNPGLSAKETVASVEAIWKKYVVNEPFEYTFLDQDFDTLFREEQRLGQVFTVMSGIAIFVACLGLLGLAAFTAEQRTKEIGIRKVMGASVASINTLLSKEFMILVGISFVIASAATWYAMDSWLSTFAYRISLGPFAFLLTGLLAAGIALLTVSYHFTRAARSNPSEALRCE